MASGNMNPVYAPGSIGSICCANIFTFFAFFDNKYISVDCGAIPISILYSSETFSAASNNSTLFFQLFLYKILNL